MIRAVLETIIIACLILLGAALVASALSAPPPGADPDSETARWYRGLQSPTGASCCDISDCRHLPTRVGKSGYEVEVTQPDGTKQWIAVPADKILPHKENPTGEPVTCWSPYLGVMCFIEGAGI